VGPFPEFLEELFPTRGLQNPVRVNVIRLAILFNC
jgi:hypothetical protein